MKYISILIVGLVADKEINGPSSGADLIYSHQPDVGPSSRPGGVGLRFYPW